jgi:hypothetical protein
MATRLKARRDTAANWVTANPVLGLGEFGWESDAKGMKLGDGTTAWNALPYYSADQILMQQAVYVLTSTTAAQALFNASANGALTLLGATTYDIECMFSLSNLSATSGTFSFGIAGTATMTYSYMVSFAKKVQNRAAPEMQEFPNTLAAVALAANSTVTVGQAHIRGQLRTNAGGTIIPQITLSVAAAANVQINSFFRARPIGPGSFATIGNWT